MVFFRGMMNQQRSLPRRKMPMRTGGNFGGAFALNPSLSGLSTITQPRNTNQVTQYGRPIYNKDGESYSEKTITEPINGKFYNIPTVGANGNILSKDQAIQSVIGQDGKIIDPISGTPLQGYADLNDAVGAAKNRSQSINISPANNMSFAQGMIGNIIPEQDGAALAKQQLGEPTMITQNIDGQRVLSDEEQSTIDNAALQERLKGRYDAPGYSTTDKIAAIAGVLGDVFSAPGDRNKTAAIMQTIEARRAGDMQRQQARLEDEQTESVVDGLIDAGQIKPESRNLYISRPDLIGKLGERFVEEGGEMFKAQLRSLNVASDVKLEQMGLSREEFEENNKQFLMQFEQKVGESDRNYELRKQQLEDAAIARKENHQLNMDKFEELKRGNKLIEGIRAQELVLKQRAANAKTDKKDFNASELDAKKFFNKGLAATETLDKIVEEGEYNPASRLQLGDDSKFKSQGRRRYETQRELWIQAVLRDESGAVIGQDELDGYARAYFPVRGDGEDVIEEKRLARIVALNGLADKTNGAVEPYAPTLIDTPSVTNIGGVNYSTQDQ